MSAVIEDGLTGDKARVDKGFRLTTFSITETVTDFASKTEDSYNINTGRIAFTGTSDSSLIYLKNNDKEDLIITAIAVGVGILSATITDSVLVTLVRNPTAGNIVTDATAVAANANLNFGSSKELAVDAFAGKDGGTITGGTDAAFFNMGSGSRLFAQINMRIPTGSSIGLKIDLGTSGGGNVYAALICHRHDANQIPVTS